MLPCRLVRDAPYVAEMMYADGSPGASSAGSDAADASHTRGRENDPLDELQQEEVCPLLWTCMFSEQNAFHKPSMTVASLPLYSCSPQRCAITSER